jgi:hypothetical protein
MLVLTMPCNGSFPRSKIPPADRTGSVDRITDLLQLDAGLLGAGRVMEDVRVEVLIGASDVAIQRLRLLEQAGTSARSASRGEVAALLQR